MAVQGPSSPGLLPRWMVPPPVTAGPTSAAPYQADSLQLSSRTRPAAGGQVLDALAWAGSLVGRFFSWLDGLFSPGNQAPGAAGAATASYFLTQFRSPYNPDGPASSANCGPTSLAMALEAFGKAPPGGNPADPEQFIEKTRLAMTGADDITSDTTVDQVLKGATGSGLQAQIVSGVSAVEAAVQAGKFVVLAGDPTAYEGGLSDARYAHFDGGHFILVTHIDGNSVTIDDPLSKVGALTISRQQLEAFMAYQGWYTGVAVWS